VAAKPLRDKQQRFIEEYLIDLNATQAAVRAGYSAKTAHEIGQENLRKPAIAFAINQAKLAQSERTSITADQTLQEYASIAFSDMREHAVWGPDGVTLKPSATLSDAAAKAVQEVSSVTKTRTYSPSAGESVTTVEVHTRIKLYNKQAALRDLAEHLKLLGSHQGALDEQFIVGFVEVVKTHAHGTEVRAAILGYLRQYLSASAA
jgi:phage terminase small subunit